MIEEEESPIRCQYRYPLKKTGSLLLLCQGSGKIGINSAIQCSCRVTPPSSNSNTHKCSTRISLPLASLSGAYLQRRSCTPKA